MEFQGLTARPYSYDYKGAMTLGQVALITGMVEFHTDGKAWIAKGIDGEEIVEAFYRNLSEGVSQSPGVDDYFAGLMASQLGLIKMGLPIVNRVTTVSKMSGRTVSTGTTRSAVTSVIVERWGADVVSEYMSDSAVPENYQMTALSSMAATGAATAGGASTGPRARRR